jgi:hypothetical protein
MIPVFTIHKNKGKLAETKIVHTDNLLSHTDGKVTDLAIGER